MKRRRVDSEHQVPATTDAIHVAFATMTHTELLEIASTALAYYALALAGIMDTVPDEIWERIISQLPPIELFQIAPVCKAWQSFTQSLLNTEYSHLCGAPHFTFSKMPGVQSLEWRSGMPQFDLAQLSHLTNLQSLKNVKFDRSISTLSTLTKLVIEDKHLYDVRFDARELLPLTNLVSLQVACSSHASLGPLSMLPNLKSLRISFPPLDNECVLQLTHLTRLAFWPSSCFSNELVLTNLVSLELGFNEFTKISRLTNLRSLRVAGMSLPKKFFKTWDKLESVDITGKQVASHLKNLKNIKKMRVTCKADFDPDPLVLTTLTNLTTLHWLQRVNNGMVYYPESLTKLSIVAGPPFPLKRLDKLTNLLDLRLQGPDLDFIDFFKSVSHLTSLTRLHVKPELQRFELSDGIVLDDATVLTNLTELQVYEGECAMLAEEFVKRLPKLKIFGHSGWPIGLEAFGILELALNGNEEDDGDFSSSESS